MRDDACPVKEFSAAVRTLDQLKSVIDYIGHWTEGKSKIVRILVDSDLYLLDSNAGALCQKAESGGPGPGDGSSAAESRRPGTEWILSLPAVLRAQDREYLTEVLRTVRSSDVLSGVITGNLEGMGFFLEQNYEGKLYADTDFYLWNSGAAALWEQVISGGCLPLELNAGEQRKLMQRSALSWEKIVYGRIPMMVTANCAARTSGRCRKDDAAARRDVLRLKDRLGKEFPVLLNCRHCFNILYNTVPLSLHREMDKWAGKAVLRLQFTIESGTETAKCLQFFLDGGDPAKRPPFPEYTTGHEKRGVQ